MNLKMKFYESDTRAHARAHTHSHTCKDTMIF